MARMRAAGVALLLALAAIETWLAWQNTGIGRLFPAGTAILLILAAAFIGRQRGAPNPPAP